MPRSMYNHADTQEDKVRSYLEPDTTEREILQYLNDNYDNTVLIINSNAALELDWLADYPNIKSVLYAPTIGASMADILTGKVSPSGRTVDTFAADASASPGRTELGDYAYYDENGNITKYNYVTYEEGIYVAIATMKPATRTPFSARATRAITTMPRRSSIPSATA